MDVKEAIKAGKSYLQDIYDGEPLSYLEVEEIERDAQLSHWVLTFGFSRPWSTPRTRAQEVLESIGATTGLRRSFKVVTLTDDGEVLSMKDRVLSAAA